MKKAYLIFLLLIFSGCFGGDSNDASKSLVNLSKNYYEISYPSGWEIIDSEELKNKAPEGTLLIIRSNEVHKGVFPNISIVEESVSEGMTSLDFAKVNIEKAPFVIYNLQTVKKEEIDVNNEKTILFSFIGRTSEQEKDLLFYQIYYTNNKKGVSITTACTSDADDLIKNLLQESIKSFKFKNSDQ